MIKKVFSDKVIEVALANGIPIQLSRLMACQSALETDNFTSKNFLEDNNGFGYKFYAKSDWQLKTPGIHSTETDCYAAYATFENSVKEICHWILRRQKETKFPQDLITIQTPEQYAHLLKSCGYYGGKEADYAAGIARYLKEFDSTQAFKK